MNDLGWIVGWMGPSGSNGARAFLWVDEVVTELELPPGAFAGAAAAVSNRGDVVGYSYMDDPEPPGWTRRAFHWRNGQSVDMGVLPGNRSSSARGVNDVGQVVGFSWDGGAPDRAFVWQNGVMADLDDFIPSDVHISLASGINASGQIVGTGVAFGFGAVGLLLTPLPAPVGDVDGDCRVGYADILRVLVAWGPCPECPADVNQDGIVDLADILVILSNWSADG